jgi:hypothetical protein
LQGDAGRLRGSLENTSGSSFTPGTVLATILSPARGAAGEYSFNGFLFGNHTDGTSPLVGPTMVNTASISLDSITYPVS